MLRRIALVAVALTSIRPAFSHGIVSGIISNGTYYTGYYPSFASLPHPPSLASWSIPLDTDLGFVPSSNFTTPDIICHVSATPGLLTIPIFAGSPLTLQWTPWLDGHHGPVMSYLAACNGSCSAVDKTLLKFVKIAESGLLAELPFPGYYAADELITNNSTWTVWVPPSLKPGEYVLRHEIIALHVAETLGEAQAYPQCINLNISGTGTDEPVGESAETLYGERDPGILVDIWQGNGSAYIIPGPTVWKGAKDLAQPTIAVLTTAPAATQTDV